MTSGTVSAIALKLRDGPDGDPLGDDAIVSKGDQVDVRAPDDGSGWLMIVVTIGGRKRLGFVPSSGVQIDAPGTAGPPVVGGGAQPGGGGGGPGKTGVVAPPVPSNDPAPFASFASSAGALCWPVVDPGPKTTLVSYHPSPGKTEGGWGRCFFDDRTRAGHPTRHHVGVDLFAAEGDAVRACADGRILNFYPFYNSHGHGQDTYALIVEHPGVVINYGEVAPDSLKKLGLNIGDPVKSGQTIARIGATAMLHFETYAPGTKVNVQWWAGHERPLQVLNPTQLLLDLAASEKGAQTGAAPIAAGVGAAPDQVLQTFTPAIRVALRLHEIGDKSPYRLFFAGKGKSGASFGFMQGDLAGDQAIVVQTFKAALAAANFAEAQISSFLQQLSVHLIKNPLSLADTSSINAALLNGSPLVDTMDKQILADLFSQLTKCIQTATSSGRAIEGKALVYMALWINMSGPPTRLLDWLKGMDPGLTRPIPTAGTTIDGPSMELYLQATSYYSENPDNFPQILRCAAAGVSSLQPA